MIETMPFAAISCIIKGQGEPVTNGKYVITQPPYSDRIAILIVGSE